MTGGGSGGHIYPLIAAVQELKKVIYKNGFEPRIRYFGAKDVFSQIFENEEVRISTIVSSKIRRYFSLANLFEPFKFIFGFVEALWKVFWFMPDAAFSKGGPGSLPVLLACKFYMIPIAIHESDSIPGLTNVISGKLAKKIFIGFESAARYFSAGKVEVSGNPIRQELINQFNQLTAENFRIESKRYFGFDENVPIILVIGGSQGATRINDFILENFHELISRFQILHQVGLVNYQAYEKEYLYASKDWSPAEKNRYKFKAFLDGQEMSRAYAAADLVLSRAGAGSIFEIAYFGKPAVLIPLPEAANGHQLENAIQYSNSGAAIVIEQPNFLIHLVAEKLTELVNNKEILAKMSEQAKKFYKPKAAELIAQRILEIAV